MVRCLRDLLAAYDVLAAHRFAVGAQAVSVSVSDSRKSNSALFKGEFAVPATRSGVNARIECSGMVAVKHDEESLHNGLFVLGASSFAGYVTVDLVTRCDVWVPFDLRGGPSRRSVRRTGHVWPRCCVHSLWVLKSETDPDDPTYFAKPNRDGR